MCAIFLLDDAHFYFCVCCISGFPVCLKAERLLQMLLCSRNDSSTPWVLLIRQFTLSWCSGHGPKVSGWWTESRPASATTGGGSDFSQPRTWQGELPPPRESVNERVSVASRRRRRREQPDSPAPSTCHPTTRRVKCALRQQQKQQQQQQHHEVLCC